jgi:4-amino-4-deoxy-L-arabinose transferase-like glycosyltransferase
MLIASILFGTNILIIGFEINVLTETLSMTLLLLSLVFTIFYIDSRKIGHFLLALIAQIFLFLLRPVYFLYPLVLIPVIGLFLLRNRQKRSFLLSTILISTFLLIPLLYATENSRNYNYFGITTVGGHNLFAKVIQYDLDTKGINKSVPFAQTLKDCIPRHKGEQSIVIDDCVRELNLSANLYDTVSSPILSNFAMKVILQQPLAYIGHSLQLLPDALTHFYPIPFDFISPYSTQPQLYTFWKFSYQFFHLLQRLMIGFLLFFPFSLYAYYKNPDKINTILLIMGTSILYLLFFNTFFVQSEYDRLRAPIEPILLLFCLLR